MMFLFRELGCPPEHSHQSQVRRSKGNQNPQECIGAPMREHERTSWGNGLNHDARLAQPASRSMRRSDRRRIFECRFDSRPEAADRYCDRGASRRAGHKDADDGGLTVAQDQRRTRLARHNPALVVEQWQCGGFVTRLAATLDADDLVCVGFVARVDDARQGCRFGVRADGPAEAQRLQGYWLGKLHNSPVAAEIRTARTELISVGLRVGFRDRVCGVAALLVTGDEVHAGRIDPTLPCAIPEAMCGRERVMCADERRRAVLPAARPGDDVQLAHGTQRPNAGIEIPGRGLWKWLHH